MRDWLYHFLIGTLDLFLWSGESIGEENLPREGPAVFVANHLDAAGPIACCCSIPLRLYPWAIGDMMERDKAAAYLNEDFTERQLHLKPPLSTWVSNLLVKITVPLFWWLGCIPVYKGDYERMQSTLHMSMDKLRQGKCLLIFPEEPSLDVDPVTQMKPFQHTFARLGEMYYEETQAHLSFYPVAVHGSGIIMVGKAIAFTPLSRPGMERQRLKSLLEKSIKKMYLSAESGDAAGELRPVNK